MLGPKMRAFLAAFEVCGNISQAANHAGVHRAAHYKALKTSREYAAAFEIAEKRFGDSLEGHARHLAMKGVLEPIYQNGLLVGQKLKFSPQLIIHLLKGVKPEKYSEKHQHAGPGGTGPIQVIVRSVLDPKPE